MNIELIILIAAAAAAVGFFVWKIFHMNAEERKQYVVDFLVGLVVVAENEIGAGHGEEKLKKVEELFQEKAPKTMKLMLKFTKTENLTDLIEFALKKVKDNFSDK